MLVIHGIWARDALCLWAEDSARPVTSAAPPGRPSRAPRPHPFAADPETIAAALAPLGHAPGAAARQAAADELTLWLPSAPDSPQAAPELVRGASPAGARARTRWPALGCWRVPALAVEPTAALAVLAALDRLAAPGGLVPGEPLASGELVPGGSIVYWAAVSWFAADLA